MRTLLTMLGIIIGVGAVIVMVAIGLGAQSQIQQQIQNLGTNMLVVTPGSSSSGGVSRGAGSFNRLTLDDAEGNDQDDVVFAPYTTVKNRLSGRSFIAQILASTSSPEDIPEAQEELALIMRESHELADWEEDDFTVRNQTELAETAESTTEVMTLLLAAIAGISLLVGGIGIMNIMLVSVTERTREIGIRMAIGARGRDVLTQFLVESIVMSILGGAIGIGVGFAGASIIGRFTGWATTISPATVVVALVFSAAVGIFFGYYPARKAAALDPIEALRYE
jgi:putative ABC transport system permease protein